MLKQTWKLFYIVKKKQILNETGATDSCILLPREINLITMLCLMCLTVIGQHFQFSLIIQ